MTDTREFLRTKTLAFAVRIVKLYDYLRQNKQEYIISKQLIRSATSIGANLAEAQCAISDSDFLAKTYISLKESNESLYWIELLYKADYITEKEFYSIYNDCEEIVKILTAITKKGKRTYL